MCNPGDFVRILTYILNLDIFCLTVFGKEHAYLQLSAVCVVLIQAEFCISSNPNMF
jgi:hypothetical protein